MFNGTNSIQTMFLLALLFNFTFAGDGIAGEVGWQTEWERTVKAAEQEGQVVIYKISGDTEWQAFQKKFPKIKVVLVPGSAAQVQQRLLAERRAGKYLADVVRLGGGTTTTLYRAKALDPITPVLILPEVKDTSKWFEGRLHYNDVENRYVLAYAAWPLHLLGYNQKLVDPQTLHSYWDLLDPKWKGKITIKDPRVPGGGSPLLFLYQNPQLGPEYIKKLFNVGGLTFIRDERQQTDWIASGKYPIALTAKGSQVEDAKKQGLPVDMLDAHAFKKDGVGLEAGGTMVALVNQAPHPNAAKVLLNWFLSRDGQMTVQKTGPGEPSQNSLREDIPKENLPVPLQRHKDTNYIRLWGPEVWNRKGIRDLVTQLTK